MKKKLHSEFFLPHYSVFYLGRFVLVAFIILFIFFFISYRGGSTECATYAIILSILISTGSLAILIGGGNFLWVEKNGITLMSWIIASRKNLFPYFPVKLVIPYDKIDVAEINIFQGNKGIILDGKKLYGMDIINAKGIIKKSYQKSFDVIGLKGYLIKKDDLIRMIESYEQLYDGIGITSEGIRRMGGFITKDMSYQFRFYLESELLIIIDKNFAHSNVFPEYPLRIRRHLIIPLHTRKPRKVLDIIKLHKSEMS